LAYGLAFSGNSSFEYKTSKAKVETSEILRLLLINVQLLCAVQTVQCITPSEYFWRNVFTLAEVGTAQYTLVNTFNTLTAARFIT